MNKKLGSLVNRPDCDIEVSNCDNELLEIIYTSQNALFEITLNVEAAEKVGFLGSPTIKVNGKDLEIERRNDNPSFSCRTYRVNGKLQGLPPEEMILQAMRKEE